MHTLTLTKEQMYELSDATHEVIMRMLRDGQDETEIKLRALAELWGAFKALRIALVGTLNTPAMQKLESQVMAAISNPKRKKA